MLCNNNCQTCLNMSNENMHYPGHSIKYAMNKSRINTLEKGNVMMVNLEKVGQVVLKSGFSISPYCDLENALYHLYNDSVKF